MPANAAACGVPILRVGPADKDDAAGMLTEHRAAGEMISRAGKEVKENEGSWKNSELRHEFQVHPYRGAPA